MEGAAAAAFCWQVFAPGAGGDSNLLCEVLNKIGNMRRCEGPVHFVARAPELPMVSLTDGALISGCR